MQVTGKVERVNQKETGKTKKGDTWEKQVFTVRTSDEYDNLYAFDAFGEKGMELMKKIEPGAEVTIEFNIRTNEYNDKFYTSLSPWRVEVKSSGSPVQPKATTKQEAAFAGESESDDLPF